MAKVPVEIDVGDVEHTLERAALERESKRVSDRALRAVATYKKLCLGRLERAVRVFHDNTHAGVVLREALHLGLPADLSSLRPDVIVQDLLVPALFDHQDERIGAHSGADLAKI